MTTGKFEKRKRKKRKTMKNANHGKRKTMKKANMENENMKKHKR